MHVQMPNGNTDKFEQTELRFDQAEVRGPYCDFRVYCGKGGFEDTPRGFPGNI